MKIAQLLLFRNISALIGVEEFSHESLGLGPILRKNIAHALHKGGVDFPLSLKELLVLHLQPVQRLLVVV